MPHPKVIAVGIVCLAIVASVVIFNKQIQFFAPPKASTQALTEAPSPTDEASWQNSFATATNTAVAVSPAILAQVDDSSAQSNSAADPVGSTLTGQLARNSFSLFLNDQQNGVTVDNTEATNIADESLANLQNVPTPQATQYTGKDIHVISDTSTAAKVAYGTAVIEAINKNSPKGASEIDILNAAAQAETNGQLPDVSQLGPIIQGYHGTIADILKASVPQDAVGIDLEFLNTASQVAADITGMAELTSDPVVAYSAFAHYTADATALSVAFTNLNDYLGISQ